MLRESSIDQCIQRRVVEAYPPCLIQRTIGAKVFINLRSPIASEGIMPGPAIWADFAAGHGNRDRCGKDDELIWPSSVSTFSPFLNVMRSSSISLRGWNVEASAVSCKAPSV